MESKIKYSFSAKIWRDNTENGWYFVTVPSNYSNEIRNNLKWQEEGWGRMKAIAIIQDLKWETSIWFDTKGKNYILPIKALIRKKLLINDGDMLTLSIYV